MMGAATEKARLPRFSLVLGIESCCDVDDLSIMCDTDGTHDTQEELSSTAGHGFDDPNYFIEGTDCSGLEQELELNDWSMKFRSMHPHDMLRHRLLLEYISQTCPSEEKICWTEVQ